MRSPRLLAYLDERCSPIPPYLLTVERNTHLRTVSPQMLSGHMQGRFLAWLVSWLSPKRILDVGTFTGYSALCFAERLPKTGYVHTIERNDELHELIMHHIQLAGFGESINLHIGDANKLIPTLHEQWDLVYLDAKKSDYPLQFELVAKQLAPGGTILLDNVLWDGQVLDTHNDRKTSSLLRDWTLALAQNERFETLMLPMSDGLMLVRERK